MSRFLPIAIIGLFSFAVYSSVNKDDKFVDSSIWGEWMHTKGLTSAIVESNSPDMEEYIEDGLVAEDSNNDHQLNFNSDGEFVMKLEGKPPVSGKYTCNEDGEIVFDNYRKVRIVMDGDMMTIIEDVTADLKKSHNLMKYIDSDNGDFDIHNVTVQKAIVLTTYFRP